MKFSSMLILLIILITTETFFSYAQDKPAIDNLQVEDSYLYRSKPYGVIGLGLGFLKALLELKAEKEFYPSKFKTVGASIYPVSKIVLTNSLLGGALFFAIGLGIEITTHSLRSLTSKMLKEIRAYGQPT